MELKNSNSCDSVDSQCRVGVFKGFVGESTGNKKDRSKPGATVAPSSLRQLWPCVVPRLCCCVVLVHRRVASPPADGHKGVLVHWKGAAAVQRFRKVGPLRPGGSTHEKHFAGQVRIPASEEEDVPGAHGDGGGIDPRLIEVGVLCPSRGKKGEGYAGFGQSHTVVLAFPPADNHL